ncbi:MAG: proline--tRNA ligase [bacterium]|nr:proline--tRNA ligase [bacterium]
MRFSQLFAPTLKETPKEAEVTSHQLMIRAGMIRQVASGIYDLLPLGLKVIRKFEAIVREELNKTGAQEVLMPSLVPAELWKESGRWDAYGKELLRVKDRMDRDYCYGPTHEEVITELVRASVRSYKQLPINLYQIQTKVRDEIRPRFGLMRSREFTMKDAYSFHATTDSLDATYQDMFNAYHRIFKRCGLTASAVSADSGAIGGSESAEFMVNAETGEDAILVCGACHHAANVEAAAISTPIFSGSESNAVMTNVETPNCPTIANVAAFLNKEESDTLKSLVLVNGKTATLVLLRGDHELNEPKLRKVLSAPDLRFATDDEIRELGLFKGYIGPQNLPLELPIICDQSVNPNADYIAGANTINAHTTGVVPNRDIPTFKVADIRNAKSGDVCGQCNAGEYDEQRGIEVGHIFKLGTKYSEAMNAVFLDQNGSSKPIIMGCYGIGVGRSVAAAIEQNHDEKGIVWPIPLAPFIVDVIVANPKESDHLGVGESIYKTLVDNNIDSILDDREGSIGFKFKDAELIGFPIQVVVGKGFKESGDLELRIRKSGEALAVKPKALLDTIRNLIDNN